jgi:cytosine/adenosine deaminase-related metal-dependent hydrolase
MRNNKTPNRFAADELIEGRECAALPAFFNAHIHALCMIGTQVRQLHRHDV